MDRLPFPSGSRAVLVGASSFGMLEELPAVTGNLSALAELVADEWGLPSEHCLRLLNPASPGAASQLIRTAATEAVDTLLVYYAGHGLLDSGGRLHLAVTDSDPLSVYDTAVPYEWIRRAVERSRATRRIVIIDCCYSARAFGPQSGNVADLAEVDGTYVMAAAAETAAALAPLGEPFTAFTAAFMDVLHAGVTGASELLNLSTIYEHVHLLLRSRELPEPHSLDRNQVGRIAFARNAAFVPEVIVPMPLPESIRSGMENPLPSIRLGAVAALGHWLTDGDPARKVTAREVLTGIADTDIAAVAGAAREILLTHACDSDDAHDMPSLLRAEERASAPALMHVRSGKSAPGIGTTDRGKLPFSPQHALSRLLTAGRVHLGRFLAWKDQFRRANRPQLAIVLLLVALTSAGSSPLSIAISSVDDDGPSNSYGDGRAADSGSGEKPFSDRVVAVAFSPDGKTLASSTWGVVTLWDVSGKTVKSRAVLPSAGYCLDFSPDGKTLASGATANVDLFDPVNGKYLRSIFVNHEDVSSVEFSQDSKTLAIGSSDGSVNLWKSSTGEHVRKMQGHSKAAGSVAFSPVGSTFASAGESESDFVKVSDPATGAGQFDLKIDFPLALAFSADGKTLAIGSVTHDIRLWETGKDKEFRKLEYPSSAWVESLDFNDDGILASGGNDGMVRLWDTGTGEQQRILAGHAAAINAVAFHPDGKILASASSDGTTRIWDAVTGKQLHSFTG
ncbi:caspase family protein [Streptomyces sp. NPDC001820]|uniref:caspase, EACC1-associated type n=1 Tax=Streptomyces sp. NPDC001820 TaxID=3364613 RepID=UPI0036974CA2